MEAFVLLIIGIILIIVTIVAICYFCPKSTRRQQAAQNGNPSLISKILTSVAATASLLVGITSLLVGIILCIYGCAYWSKPIAEVFSLVGVWGGPLGDCKLNGTDIVPPKNRVCVDPGDKIDCYYVIAPFLKHSSVVLRTGGGIYLKAHLFRKGMDMSFHVEKIHCSSWNPTNNLVQASTKNWGQCQRFIDECNQPGRHYLALVNDCHRYAKLFSTFLSV